jgi:1-acyl-sn-glycerol-3-phosphate acyltransferase
MNVARGVSRGAILLSGMAGAALDFPWQEQASRRAASRKWRAEWLHRHCRSAMGKLGIEVRVEGPVPERGLVVCNHLSYLDILILSAAFPCIFVSKLEVRSWPLFGWLARLGGTIFVDRRQRSETPRVRHCMEEALREGIPVVLFPEGTSTDGSRVLPFRSALFEPAVRLGQQVTPAHIGYEVAGGTAARDVCYWGGMTLMPHLFRLLSKGKITGRIRIAAQSRIYSNRKQAALRAREEVVALSGAAGPCGAGLVPADTLLQAG